LEQVGPVKLELFPQFGLIRDAIAQISKEKFSD